MTDKIKHPPMIGVESTNVKSIGHNEHGLFVSFKSGGVYRYPSAPASLYVQGLAAKSPGAWFRENIKDKFEHHKL